MLRAESLRTMVDSRKGGGMADRIAQAINKRFDEIDAALGELREYTEFAYGRLEEKIDVGFARVERIERKLDQFIDGQKRQSS